MLGLLLGGFLGIFDGLTALLSAPETAKAELGTIVIGSVIKGFLTGVLIGFFSQKMQSLWLGILFGLLVGAGLSFGVAWMQYVSMGRVYFWQIMTPGAVLGIILGYVTQTQGKR